MKEELGYNRVMIAGQSMDHKQIKDNLELQLARNLELEKMISDIQERCKDYEKEITIKNQEIMDIRMENHSEEQKNTIQENIVEGLQGTISMLKKHKGEGELRIAELV